MPWSKESRQSRGYGSQWVKIRKLVMARDKGLCQPCAKESRVTRATQVDHVVSKAEAVRRRWTQAQVDDPANLQAICTPCHDRKTTEENGGTYRPKVEIGLDGWPKGE